MAISARRRRRPDRGHHVTEETRPCRGGRKRHRPDRRKTVAGKGARPHLLQPHGSGLLLLVEAADVVDAEADCREHLLVHLPEGGVEFRFGGAQRRLIEFGAIELAGEADQRCVAFAAHRLDDRSNPVDEGREIGLRAAEETRAVGGRERGQFVKGHFGHGVHPSLLAEGPPDSFISTSGRFPAPPGGRAGKRQPPHRRRRPRRSRRGPA